MVVNTKKLTIVVMSLVALGSGFTVSWYFNDKNPIVLESGVWFGDRPRALPEFELIDHNNQIITRNSFMGKWNLLFFGYTHCPDICPTTLQAMNQMVESIDEPDVLNSVQIYFVSVDPERDNTDVLRNYISYFNPAFVAATAPDSQLRILTGSINIPYHIRKISEDDMTYDVGHSASIVLINPRAEFAGLFGSPHKPLQMARDMVRIVERG